ncbi:glutamine amidotransferase [Ancrocorticia sp.]|uniref:glutamine amidotransferase n=1 Tax=Ancrocorticia sp. TaxID=2593684 RepID=UPI003F8D9527
MQTIYINRVDRRTMKPFVLISSRPEPALAHSEYESFLRHCGLNSDQLIQIRVDQEPLPNLQLDDYSGILVGGSPFNASIPPSDKSPVQQRVEAEMGFLLDKIVPRDFPFFGACYGVATLGLHEGGTVDTTFGETVTAGRIALTQEGRKDPITLGIPDNFDAYLGHTEAIRTLPASAILLATSGPCPIQMFRVGTNMYATQFHPELDHDALAERLLAYDGHGYYPAGEAAVTIAGLVGADVAPAHTLLRNFALRYARD